MPRTTSSLAALGLVLGLALAGACGDGGDGGGDGDGDGASGPIDRDGSVVVDGAPDVEIGAPLQSYSITYRVEEREGDDAVVRDATFTIERPFRSRFEAGTTTRVADFAYFGEREAGDETEVRAPVPAPAPGDVRADLLDLDDGREVRRVAGRTCQVHRSGAPLLSSQVVAGDGVDTCIDGDGLILEELVTDEEGILTRWLATSVDTSPSLADDLFRFDGVVAIPAEAGGGSVQEVEPTSRSVGEFFELDAPPAGFAHEGRFAVVPPQRARPDDESSRAQVVAGVVDVWVRGVDVLVVEQGGTLGQVPPFGAHPRGVPVDDLGAVVGVGESIVTVAGGEVRVLIAPGRYVKVVGTLPVGELVAVLRSLRPVEGTGLVYLE